MVERLEIKGGADEFEAAVIAVVIDKITNDEKLARQGRANHDPRLPAWIRVQYPEEPNLPREQVRPDG